MMSPEYGVNMNQETNIKSKNEAILKFIVFSAIGIIFFCIPVTNGQTLLVYSIGALKKLFGSSLLQVFVIIASVGLVVLSVLQSTKKINIKYIAKDGIPTKILYILSVIFSLMAYFKIGPGFIVNPDTGIMALNLSTSIILTVSLAGSIVTFIVSYGLLQFLGTFLEPLMRPIYGLPGYAAVDIAASSASSGTVDVFMANKIYLSKFYTKREVASVAVNFTIGSLPYFLVMSQIAGIPEYYGTVTLATFVGCFIIAIVTMRIPPLSRIPNEYVDGTPWTGDKKSKDSRSLLKRSWDAAIETAEGASSKLILEGIGEAFFFSLKVVTYVVAIATIALIIATYTPVFKWIGVPLIPVLNLFGIPNAVQIAPSVLVGITEISIAPLLIAPLHVAPAASFFICVLAMSQLIFFTATGNAILQSDIPLNFWQLIATFFIRTALLIPLIALMMHLIF